MGCAHSYPVATLDVDVESADDESKNTDSNLTLLELINAKKVTPEATHSHLSSSGRPTSYIGADGNLVNSRKSGSFRRDIYSTGTNIKKLSDDYNSNNNSITNHNKDIYSAPMFPVTNGKVIEKDGDNSTSNNSFKNLTNLNKEYSYSAAPINPIRNGKVIVIRPLLANLEMSHEVGQGLVTVNEKKNHRIISNSLRFYDTNNLVAKGGKGSYGGKTSLGASSASDINSLNLLFPPSSSSNNFENTANTLNNMELRKSRNNPRRLFKELTSLPTSTLRKKNFFHSLVSYEKLELNKGDLSSVNSGSFNARKFLDLGGMSGHMISSERIGMLSSVDRIGDIDKAREDQSLVMPEVTIEGDVESYRIDLTNRLNDITYGKQGDLDFDLNLDHKEMRFILESYIGLKYLVLLIQYSYDKRVNYRFLDFYDESESVTWDNMNSGELIKAKKQKTLNMVCMYCWMDCQSFFAIRDDAAGQPSNTQAINIKAAELYNRYVEFSSPMSVYGLLEESKGLGNTILEHLDCTLSDSNPRGHSDTFNTECEFGDFNSKGFNFDELSNCVFRHLEDKLLALFRSSIEIYSNFKREIEEESEMTRGVNVFRRNCRLHVDDFVYIKRIGKGGFARVIHVMKKSTNQHFAMKIQSKFALIKYNGKKKGGQLGIEKTVLARNSECPFIVDLSYSLHTQTCAILVLNLVTGGDLYDLIHLSPKKRLTESLAKIYTYEIALALNHLHENGVIYRDLKPSNVLVDAFSGHIKLTDMGLAAPLYMYESQKANDLDEDPPDDDSIVGEGEDEIFSPNTKPSAAVLKFLGSSYIKDNSDGGDGSSRILSSETSTRSNTTRIPIRRKSIVGTRAYLAPEMLEQTFAKTRRGYTEMIDYFALGVTLFEMVAGERPWAEFEPKNGGRSSEVANPSNMESGVRKGLDDKKDELIVFPQGYVSKLHIVKYPTFFSEQLVDVISNLVVRDPDVRFNCQHISNHGWMDEVRVASLYASDPEVIPEWVRQERKVDSDSIGGKEKCLPMYRDYNHLMKDLSEKDKNHTRLLWTSRLKKKEKHLFSDWDYISQPAMSSELMSIALKEQEGKL